MNRKLSLLFLVVVFGFPGFTYAQNAGGILAPSRMIDWAQAGVVGGIPNRTSICATLSPGASASQINSAIASCPSDQVVSLNAGTYNLSSGIDFAGHSNVTLRGAGPDKTFLVFTGGVNCNGATGSVCIEGDPIWSNPSNLANWTGGYSQGSTQVTLSNVNNLKVGSYINFDQLNDSSDPGAVFVCDTSGVCSTEGTGGVYRSGRAENQLVTVTGISGTTVSITPSIYMPNWRSSQSPQAFWPTNQASKDGVEDLSIDNSTNTSSLDAISINSATNSWVKNVRTINPNRDHVQLRNTSHCTIADSYFYGTQSGQVSEYGVELDEDSDSLVINNIFQHIVSPILPGPDTGSVYAYNYSIDDWYSPSPGWMQAAYNAHAAGTAFDLYESNEGDSFQSDDIHGTHNFMTLFRNYLLGWQSGATNNTEAVEIESFGRYYNFVGNVLGRPGYHTQYEDLAPSGTNMAKSIYVLGWSGNGGKTGNAPNDPIVVTTLMRWGNYDVVTGAVRWDSSEVPSGLSRYANPVPSSHALPASFFLSAKPSWWGTPWGAPPWPAIGPEVTGGPGPGGHSYDIPAKLCYNNTSKDSNGILNFNAKSCYESSAAPGSPTNLSATPH